MTVQELQQQQKQVVALIENLAFDNSKGLLDDDSINTFLTELKNLGYKLNLIDDFGMFDIPEFTIDDYNIPEMETKDLLLEFDFDKDLLLEFDFDKDLLFDFDTTIENDFAVKK